MFNATLNNISVISSWSVLLVKETGVPGENHRPVALSTPRYEQDSNSQLLVVIGTNCTGSCKLNYRKINGKKEEKIKRRKNTQTLRHNKNKIIL
jgi:hypothetical protein